MGPLLEHRQLRSERGEFVASRWRLWGNAQHPRARFIGHGCQLGQNRFGPVGVVCCLSQLAERLADFVHPLRQHPGIDAPFRLPTCLHFSQPLLGQLQMARGAIDWIRG